MQYIVSPSIHYAFEHNSVDEVVGTTPDPEQTNDNNIVSLCCTEISVNRDTLWCDLMSIVMYQFFVLLVQKCPAHIHDPTRK